LISCAPTGIDDSSYPGKGTLISDYFPPEQHSRIFGFLQLSIPLGYLLDLLLSLNYSPRHGWGIIYLFTGAIGLLLSLLIFFGVKDIPKGSSDPQLSSVIDLKTTKVQ